MKTRILEKANQKDINTFKHVPIDLYKRNSYWVPPFPGEIETVMDPSRHPFYRHSEADFIVVESGKQKIGRIAVLYNKKYCDFHDEKTAFFYYFDCVNDNDAAQLLLTAAEDWARARGLDRVYGPRGFLRSNGIGLLVEGFDQLPAVGIPYNFNYYAQLLEFCGYKKSHDYYSGYLDKHPDPKILDVSKKVLSRGNFTVVSFKSTQELLQWIPRVDEVHHQAFANNPGYYPSSPDEFELQARNIIAIADPKYIKLIMHKDQLAGFIIGYPNINRSIQRSRGRLFPFGWLFISVEQKFPRLLDLNGVGILPEYQGLGGNVLLYAEVDKVTHQPGLRRAEIVQVDERNFRSKSDMETLGVTFSKIHRIYQKQL